MRDMPEITEQKGQCVLTGFKLDLGFGLAAAKMPVLVIRWNWHVQIRQAGIDEQVMMALAFEFYSGRRHAHSA